MSKINIIFILLGLGALGVVGLIAYRHHQKKNFDLTPRDRSGNQLETDEDIQNDPSQAEVYEGDFGFTEWEDSFESLFQEYGLVDIRNGMLEFETGENSRLFVMLAEMKQANPYLKTHSELNQASIFMEVFLNMLKSPLKMTAQNQKVELTDFLNELQEQSQYMKGSNDAMKEYARNVLDNTKDYQKEADRFENRVYAQFMAIVEPDEVYGDTTEILEQRIQEKALDKLLRQIVRANDVLMRADHGLVALDQYGLVEVLHNTFHRESSIKVRFEDIIKRQRVGLFTTAKQPDKLFKEVKERIEIENKLLAHARDAMWLQKQIDLADKLVQNQEISKTTQNSEDTLSELANLD
ncbi:hypothetical protein FP435_00175 (plasmid) [Lactobacillus sp. PV037]|uniref:hypothetical protein n=1 Tax=Lactobacillus sp. PV037 TaxID=2594496 RepID=UPI00223F7B9C|nr:hypothetical protein [Lactobacillus sp. PV037]QNQ82954.1 hypothetical protein FP435_00175 [Lactobacillus sp. PV037]